MHWLLYKMKQQKTGNCTEHYPEEKSQITGVFLYITGTHTGIWLKKYSGILRTSTTTLPTSVNKLANMNMCCPHVLKSVSYTHLDVYKRQVHGRCGTRVESGNGRSAVGDIERIVSLAEYVPFP